MGCIDGDEGDVDMYVIGWGCGAAGSAFGEGAGGGGGGVGWRGITRLGGEEDCGDCGAFRAGGWVGDASAGMSSSRPTKDRR